MKGPEIAQAVQQKFPADVIETKTDVRQPWALVKPAAVADICRFLRDDAAMKFDFLRMISGVDLKDALEAVYHLFSYAHEHEFVLRCRVTKDDPTVPTVEGVWPAANWHEREAYDLVGIQFRGHSDLRRIMLPDDWEGHPLRKDYREKDQYNGVATTRPYLTGMPELPTLPPLPSDGSQS